jgi:hypothetical protein
MLIVYRITFYRDFADLEVLFLFQAGSFFVNAAFIEALALILNIFDAFDKI